jgi:hypothetical protein
MEGKMNVPTEQQTSDLEQVVDETTVDSSQQVDDQPEDKKEDKPEDNIDTNGEKSKSELRYQKLANSNKEYRKKVQEYERQIAELSGAKNLHDLLQKDKTKLAKVMAMISGEHKDEKQDEFSYDEFEDIPKKKFQQIDQIAKELKGITDYIESIKAEKEQATEKNIKSNVENLDATFNDLLAKNGIKDSGTIESVEYIALGKLSSMVENPLLATEKQLNEAFDFALKALKINQGRKEPPPPPTGSGNGRFKVGNSEMTDEDRLKALANFL